MSSFNDPNDYTREQLEQKRKDFEQLIARDADMAELHKTRMELAEIQKTISLTSAKHAILKENIRSLDRITGYIEY